LPVTTLDANTALLVVDLQKGILALPLADPIDGVVARAADLVRAFRAHRLPVVLINVTGTAPGRTEQPARLPGELPADFAEFIPELDRQPSDIVVTKRTWGAFASTDIEAKLKALGVTQVVVIGVATASGVESTARQAYEAGFNVTLAIDAMTDMRPDAHAYSIARVFPRLGETGTAQAIIDLLAERGN
jgi:nicotinamidase-related amidase